MTELVDLPAVCDICSTVFQSGYALSGRGTYIGNKAGPCPNCGGIGSVPDGIYEVIDRVVTMAPTVGATRVDLLRLRALIQESQTLDLDVLTAEAAVSAPTAAPLLDVLRDPAFANVVGLLGLLVAIAALIVAMQG